MVSVLLFVVAQELVTRTQKFVGPMLLMLLVKTGPVAPLTGFDGSPDDARNHWHDVAPVATTATENVSPPVSVTLDGCVTIEGAVHSGTVSTATLLSALQPFVARTQKRVVAEIGPVKRIVPKLKYSSDASSCARNCSSVTPPRSAATNVVCSTGVPVRCSKRGKACCTRRVIASPELRMARPTFSRELLPSCVRNAVVSGALGERPRTSLNIRLIQPAFVEPASAKYSGDAVI